MKNKLVNSEFGDLTTWINGKDNDFAVDDYCDVGCSYIDVSSYTFLEWLNDY